jgi:hypothetical protein
VCGKECTLIQLKIGNRLPFVRCHEPLVVLLPATEIDDELRRIVVEGAEDGVKTRVREGARGEEVRSYDYLLRVGQCAFESKARSVELSFCLDSEGR